METKNQEIINVYKEYDKSIEEALVNEVVERHSFFQLKNFVIGKEPTHQAKLWRCLKELESRKKSIDSMKMEIENVKDSMEILEIEINDNKEDCKLSEKEIKINEIKKRQKKRSMYSLMETEKELYRKMKYAYEEAMFFTKMFEALNKQEKVKPFDDMESQISYWNEKLSHELNIKILNGITPDVELIKTILSLDKESPVKKEVLSILSQNQGLVMIDRKKKAEIIDTVKQIGDQKNG